MTSPLEDPTGDSARLYLAVGRLHRALRRDAREAVVGHGGLSALASLITDGPQRAGALAQTEGITAPAMTRILNSLDQLGYVTREPDPDDGRAQLVTATAAGRELVVRGRAARLQALEERFARLEGSDRTAIIDALDGLERLTSGPNEG